MSDRPNDRITKNGTSGSQPKILSTVDIKIPDKEVHLMNQDEQAPSGGTCSCHSVCTCMQVNNCMCDTVCTCDAVCSTNTCSCHPFTGCSQHVCTCVPVCSCHGHCSTCSTGHYWHPN